MSNRPRDWAVLRCEDLLSDGVLEIGDGYRAKNSEMGPSGLPFVRGGNLKEDGFHLEDADTLDESNIPRAGAKVSQPGDVVFTSKGTIGRIAYVKSSTPRMVYSPQLSYWRVNDSSVIDPRFLFYWIQGPDFVGQAYQVQGSTDMADYVNLSDQRRMTITAPPLPTQRKIAAILSTYDDLIENNTRRIAILEEMTQAIYREWFVEFRFPGHESVAMVESELGPIPAGWEVVTLESVTTKIGSGATPRGGRDSYKSSGIALVRSLNVFDFEFKVDGLAFIDEEQANALSNVEVSPGDILLNITGASVARCCMIPGWILPARVNQHVAIIRANPDVANPFYVLHCINDPHNKHHLLTLAQGGATREALTKTTLQDFKILLPPVHIQNQLADIFASYELTHTLQQKEMILREARDLLLPRLMSGEVDVSELTIE